MATFKSFRELKQAQEHFEAQKQAAKLSDEMSSAWRWFERNVDYKQDEHLPLRSVHSHGRKGTFKTLAPVQKRVAIS